VFWRKCRQLELGAGRRLQRRRWVVAEAEVRLEHVDWSEPVVVGAGGLELHVELFAEDDGRTSYEIYSASEGRRTRNP